jgi:hypothetical protein
MIAKRFICAVLFVGCNWLHATLGFAPAFVSASSRRSTRISSTVLGSSTRNPPAPLAFVPKPLPVLLGGGLFLFGFSVKAKDRPFADKLLELSQSAMRADPTITMELGQGVETGGVYSSVKGTANADGRMIDQLVLQFQIEGGNAWAQGVAYGIKEEDGRVQLVSLEVANMDASMNGTPLDVPILSVNKQLEEEH